MRAFLTLEGLVAAATMRGTVISLLVVAGWRGVAVLSATVLVSVHVVAAGGEEVIL